MRTQLNIYMVTMKELGPQGHPTQRELVVHHQPNGINQPAMFANYADAFAYKDKMQAQYTAEFYEVQTSLVEVEVPELSGTVLRTV